MQFTHVPLDQVDDNPLQPRQSYTGIDELAASILDNLEGAPDTAGLIHVPLARVVDDAGNLVESGKPDGTNRVQIAVGHRRLRAFRFLAETGDQNYNLFPVILTDMTDADMATMSWRENKDRQDLSPMDEARAFQLMSEVLGWKQSEIAEAINLSRSAVSNKLRLLNFPAWVQDLIHAGELPEKSAREAMPLLEMPDELKRGIFYDAAGNVRSSRDIAQGVQGAIERKTADLTKATWDPLDMWTPSDNVFPIKLDAGKMIISKDVQACANCPNRRKVAGRERCFDPICYTAKTAGYKFEVLGPEKAKSLYTGFSAWKRTEIAVPPYSNCAACGIKANLAQTNAGWYSPTSQQWITICPKCWDLAGLPDPSAEPVAEPEPVAVVGSPPGDPSSTPQVSRETPRALPTPSTPQAPAAPTRPPLVMERVETPKERPQVITIVITAGTEPDRQFTASMGDEIAPGRVSLDSMIMRQGPLDRIGDVVADLVAEFARQKTAI